MPEVLSEQIQSYTPDYSHIVTEDDTPVDNIFSEKQRRLLTETLNSSWQPGRPFLAASDVGVFYDLNLPPVVPDMFLSLDVRLADDIWEKKNRSYFLSVFGKPPEIAVEVVSNTEGGETGKKFGIYASAGIMYYIVFDPQRLVQKGYLRVYMLSGGKYIPVVGCRMPDVGLSLKLWKGIYEGRYERWLRWCDPDGKLIPTGAELAESERLRANAAEKKADKALNIAESERLRAENERLRVDEERLRANAAEKKADEARNIAESERLRAENESLRAEKFAEKLRLMGINPEEIAGSPE